MKVQPDIPPDPNEVRYLEIDDIFTDYQSIIRRHKGFKCRGQGVQRTTGPKAGEWLGCPKCQQHEGDAFAAWKLEVELDYLCYGGDTVVIPDIPQGEEL